MIPPRWAYGLVKSQCPSRAKFLVAKFAVNPKVPKLLQNSNLWLDEEVGTYQESSNPATPCAFGGYSAAFAAASSQYLLMPDTPALSMAPDLDFTISMWIYLTSKPAGGNYMCFGKKGGGTFATNEWYLYYDGTSDRLIFTVGNNSAYGTVTWGSALSLSTWYHVTAWHDSVGDKLYICVNDGTPVSAGYSSGSYDSSGTVAFGQNNSTSFLNGRLTYVGCWKRLLSAVERTSLYNGGLGQQFETLPPTLKNNLVAYWNFWEAVVRYDSFGTNNSTTHTATRGVGLGGTNAQVGTWKDLSKMGNHLTQGTAGSRPFKAALGLEFDGSDDSLFKTSVANPSGVTDFFVGISRTLVTSGGLFSRTTSNAQYALMRHIDGVPYWSRDTAIYVYGPSAITDLRVKWQIVGSFTGSSIATDMKLWQNGLAASTRNGTPSGLSVTDFRLCAAPNMSLACCGVVAFNSILSTFDRRMIERYLAQRFGMTYSG